MIFAVPDANGQQLAREALRELLTTAQNEALPSAAEQASHGPAARAARLIKTADGLIAEPPTSADDSLEWRLRLEGVAREIDAGFGASDMPEDLAAVRARLVELLDAARDERRDATVAEFAPALAVDGE